MKINSYCGLLNLKTNKHDKGNVTYKLLLYIVMTRTEFVKVILVYSFHVLKKLLCY